MQVGFGFDGRTEDEACSDEKIVLMGELDGVCHLIERCLFVVEVEGFLGSGLDAELNVFDACLFHFAEEAGVCGVGAGAGYDEVEGGVMSD